MESIHFWTLCGSSGWICLTLWALTVSLDLTYVCNVISSLFVYDAKIMSLISLSSLSSASNLTHYFSTSSMSSSPARALLLVAALLVAYWFLSLFLSGFFYILHAVFGRFFWLARVALFALSCLYILQKFEGDPEKAVLPLCFIMAVYFMTGPVGAYWRKGADLELWRRRSTSSIPRSASSTSA